MKNYSTYIFDLDGTITDTMALWLDILRDGLIEFGFTSFDDQVLIQYSHDWREFVKIGFPKEKIEALTEYFHVVANRRLPAAPLQKGAYETLELLKKRGKRIAIFSTMGRPIFEPAMHYRNLYAITDVAIAGTDVLYRKPHPDGILKALKDLEIPQEEFKNAVYVGDKDTDIQAAHNAGIDSILYYPVNHQLMYDLTDLKKNNPAYIITDWQELH